MRFRGYFNATSEAIALLEALGYAPEREDRGFDSITIKPEHETLFTYRKGDPATPGYVSLSISYRDRIRRRCRDALNKTSDFHQVLAIAKILKVKTFQEEIV